MDRTTALARLRARESELRAMGVESLSLFGSVARGEAGPDSDVDLAARFDPNRRIGLFRRERIEDWLGTHVDLISEPIERPRLRARVEQDRVHVF